MGSIALQVTIDRIVIRDHETTEEDDPQAQVIECLKSQPGEDGLMA